jgi:hypothetical protein
LNRVVQRIHQFIRRAMTMRDDFAIVIFDVDRGPLRFWL